MSIKVHSSGGLKSKKVANLGSLAFKGWNHVYYSFMDEALYLKIAQMTSLSWLKETFNNVA